MAISCRRTCGLRRAVGMGLVAGLLMVATATVPAHADPTPKPSGSDLVIKTAVGTGVPGFGGDAGPARQASLAQPRALATAPDGTLYIVTGLRIRAVDPKDGTITTVAGTGESGFSGDGGPGTKATFSEEGRDVLDGLSGIAVGSDGTLYVADAGNHRVRAVDPETGTIRTVTGGGKTGDAGGRFAGDGGPATKARLHYPTDVAVGEDGTLYIADTQNYRVRAVDPDSGTIKTIAGVRHAGDSGSVFFPEPDDGGEGAPATSTFVEPEAVAVGPGGTVYIAESQDDRVRAINPKKNTITTVAGDGATSYLQNSTDLYLQSPTDLAMGDGVLYITTNDLSGMDVAQNRVYALDLESGGLEEFAGGAPRGALGDGGPPTDAFLAGPPASGSMGIAYGPDGTVYIADQLNNRVRAVTEQSTAGRHRDAKHPMAAQRIVTLVGSGTKLPADEGTGWFSPDVHRLDEVDLSGPSSVVVDRDGTIYIAGTGNDRIRVVRPGADTVHTLAGTAELRYADEDNGDGGPADKAYLTGPTALALGPDHRLYFTDDIGPATTIRVIDLDEGTIDTAVGSHVGIDTPSDIAVGPDSALYIADSGNNRVCKIKPDADECETIAGGDSGVGPSAEVPRPQGLAFGADGALYVADGSFRVRAIDVDSGQVRTVAGVGSPGLSGDGGPATSAQIGMPGEMDVHDGTLYLTDLSNHRIRAVDLTTGVIQAVAGTGKGVVAPTVSGDGGGGFSGDGGPAGKSKLANPTSVAVGPDGALYVADRGNNRVRLVGDVDVSARGGFPFRTVGYAVGGLVVLAVLATVAVLLRRRRRRRDDPDPRPA